MSSAPKIGLIGASDLWGCSLADAFKKIVLLDAEVMALIEKASAPESGVTTRERDYCQLLKTGRYPGPHGSFDWSLDLTSTELAFDFVRPMLFVLGDGSPMPEASPIIEALAELLVGRLSILKGHLVSKRVLAQGTFSSTGRLVTIEALQWDRSDASINVRNSDFAVTIDRDTVLRWNGVSLHKPKPSRKSSVRSKRMFHVEHIGRDDLRSRTKDRKVTNDEDQKLTAAQVSTLEAIGALWPNGIPSSVSPMLRDKLILNWQKDNNRTVVSRKTIERVLKRH